MKTVIMWLSIFLAIMAATIAGIIYMCRVICRFCVVKRLTGESKWKKILISLGIIVIFFTIFTIWMTLMNAIVIFLHILIFRLLFGLIGRIIRRKNIKEIPFDLQSLCAVAVTIVYLSAGYYLCHHVWETDYSLQTDKEIDNLHIVMFADSHVGATFDGNGFAGHIESIKNENPDLVLIPGDFVDSATKKQDMITACRALGTIDAKYGVWFAYGNHDETGISNSNFTNAELLSELEKNGVHVLKDEYRLVDEQFYIVGRDDAYNTDRKPVSDLMRELDSSKYIVVMDHQPTDYDNEADTAADLVVSGHTHGGQLFPLTHLGSVMRFNDRTYGYERRKGTDFIVTSGIADWDIKFKTGTKSEYTVIDVVSFKKN